MKRKIIFVHGFGVRKDARGFFTDIRDSLSTDENFKDIECIFTDLNVIDEVTGNIHLNTLAKQAEILKEVYEKDVLDSKVFIVAHSQGCVVAGMCNFENVEKTILICPPTNNDIDRSIEIFKNRPGTVINLDGSSTLARLDGSKTIVSKEYWLRRKDVDYMKEYGKLFDKNLFVIFAKQDDLLANDSVEEFSKIGRVEILDGNHNFDGEARVGLISKLKEIL